MLIVAFYFEVAPVQHNKKCDNKASITYEVILRLPDKNGNTYPTYKTCYIVVTKTVNSHKGLTELYLTKVLLTGAVVSSEVTYDHWAGILWDDFKAHSCPPGK